MRENVDPIFDANTTYTPAELVNMMRTFGCGHYARYLHAVLETGRGCVITTMERKKVIDMIALYSAASLGYRHPELLKHARGALSRCIAAPNTFLNTEQPPLLAAITAMTRQDRALLANTGADAIEAAWKAIRRWARRVKGIPENVTPEVIACEGNFHGRSITALGMSTNEHYRDDFGPFPDGIRIVPYDDIPALRDAITPATAAFIVEPVQGEGGIRIPRDGYLREANRIAAEKNILFVADEVQTGFGRTGMLWGCDHDGVHPDLIVLAKALGQGVPVGAIAGRRDVMDVFDAGSHGSTFAGTAFVAAIARKSIDLHMRDDCALIAQGRRIGAYIFNNLLRWDHPFITDIRHRGPMIGIEIDERRTDPERLRDILMEEGIMTGIAGKNVIRMTPALVMTKSIAHEAIARMRRAFDRARSEC